MTTTRSTRPQTSRPFLPDEARSRADLPSDARAAARGLGAIALSAGTEVPAPHRSVMVRCPPELKFRPHTDLSWFVRRKLQFRLHTPVLSRTPVEPELQFRRT